MDDRDHMIDVLARLPLAEFLARVKRMASATYRPGSALNTAPPQPTANPRQAHIADSIGKQRQNYLRALIRDGRATRDIAINTGVSEAEIERQRALQSVGYSHVRKRVLVVRNS